MKFGRQLQFIQVEKWKGKYINYSFLKKEIKSIFGPYLNPSKVTIKPGTDKRRFQNRSKHPKISVQNKPGQLLFPDGQTVLTFKPSTQIRRAESTLGGWGTDGQLSSGFSGSMLNIRMAERVHGSTADFHDEGRQTESHEQPIEEQKEITSQQEPIHTPIDIPPTVKPVISTDDTHAVIVMPTQPSTEEPPTAEQKVEVSETTSEDRPEEEKKSQTASEEQQSAGEAQPTQEVQSTGEEQLEEEDDQKLLQEEDVAAKARSPSNQHESSVPAIRDPVLAQRTDSQPGLKRTESQEEVTLQVRVEEWGYVYEQELRKVIFFVRQQVNNFYGQITALQQRIDSYEPNQITVGKTVQLKRHFLNFCVEAQELMNYVGVNKEGFRKILKKLVKVVSQNETEVDEEGHEKTKIVSYVKDEKEQMEEATNAIINGLPKISAIIDRIVLLYVETFCPDGKFGSGGDPDHAEELLTMTPKHKQQLEMELRTELLNSVEAQIAWKKNTILGEYLTHQQKAQLPGQLTAQAGDGLRDRTISSQIVTPQGDIVQEEELSPEQLALKKKEESRKDMHRTKWIPVIIAYLVLIVFGAVPWPSNIASQMRCLGLLLYAGTLWCTEAIPPYVTSLSIPMYATFLQVAGPTGTPLVDASKAIVKAMMSNTVLLAIGGFSIALAMKHSKLDTKLAGYLLQFKLARNPHFFIMLIMVLEYLLTMVISNVSSTMLAVSICLPILRETPVGCRFNKAILLGIALCGNIAGMATPLASPQSMIAYETCESAMGDAAKISFGSWVGVAIPNSLVICAAGYVVLVFMYRIDIKEVPFASKKQTFLNFKQFYVAIISIATIALWFVVSYVPALGNEATIALIPFVFFFGFGFAKKTDLKELPWNIVLLVMGGSALGEAIKSSKLLEMIAGWFSGGFSLWPVYVKSLILTLVVFVVAIIVSHTVSALIFLPIIASIMAVSGNHVELVVVMCSFTISCPMILTVGSFPNICTASIEDAEHKSYVGSKDFLTFGTIVSVIGFVITNGVGFGLSFALGL
ncbi:Divalent Anion:Na+ Symporter [Blattamonas nauphoetae]|uniref:Divalent Anion:Na+ Symporter n=1 Tax=Blattamonas nauphoetae TaxID=2049346 RepID=A0ABQ9Y621_9EUKA|nr:Divalent Anion:Na+ Symporter [Blattamonas nauphoetae]